MSKDDIKLSPKHGLNPTMPVCFWCGKEKNEVALMGKMDKQDSEAPRHMVVDYEPCDTCKELFSKGVHVIGVTSQPMAKGQFPIMQNPEMYPTGSMFVAPKEWMKAFLEENQHPEMVNDVLEKGVMLMPDEIVSKIVEESNAPEMEVATKTVTAEGENKNEDN